MLGFFIALFGILYYTSRYNLEKSEAKRIDQEAQQRYDSLCNEYDQWIQDVVDEELEYFTALDTDKMSAMRARIKEETGLSFGDDAALAGLLAQSKKIPREFATTGIATVGFGDYSERLRRQNVRKFLLWYDNELRKNGFSEPLLFAKAADHEKITKDITVAKPITETSETEVFGFYFWKPMRMWVY